MFEHKKVFKYAYINNKYNEEVMKMIKIKIKKMKAGTKNALGMTRYGYCDLCERGFKKGFEYRVSIETREGNVIYLLLLCKRHFRKLSETMKKVLEEEE
jgi:hypothetical protein